MIQSWTPRATKAAAAAAIERTVESSWAPTIIGIPAEAVAVGTGAVASSGFPPALTDDTPGFTVEAPGLTVETPGFAVETPGLGGAAETETEAAGLTGSPGFAGAATEALGAALRLTVA